MSEQILEPRSKVRTLSKQMNKLATLINDIKTSSYENQKKSWIKFTFKLNEALLEPFRTRTVVRMKYE